MLLVTREICPACKKNEFKELFSLSYKSEKMKIFLKRYYKERIDLKKLSENYYKLLECKNCNLIFQAQIPSDEFSQHLYEDIIDREDSLLKKNDFEKKFHKKLIYETNLIKGIFNKDNENISILEFGAGWGFWLRYMKKINFDVYAYEVSDTRINFMKQNQIKVISNIDNSSKKFDFIYSEQTFEHISNPQETLISLSKLLNDKGFILLRFPSNFLFKFKLNNKYNPSTDCAHPLEHINLFKKDSFKEMIKDANLQIVNIKSKYNFSLKNILLDLKNYLYFDSVLIKKID